MQSDQSTPKTKADPVGIKVIIACVIIGSVLVLSGFLSRSAAVNVSVRHPVFLGDSGTEKPEIVKEEKRIVDKPLSTEEIVARSEGSVALIVGKQSSGTGFLVQPGVIVTNRHVIAAELDRLLEVHFPSAGNPAARGPLQASLLYEDDSRDLAFLAVRTELKPIPVIREYRFRRGQDVVVIGNPGLNNGQTLQNAVSKGVTSAETVIEGQSFCQLGISINAGNSGGPVLDSLGQVIGVATSKASDKEGLAFCIPGDQLVSAMGRLNSQSAEDILSTQSRHRHHFMSNRVAVVAKLYAGQITVNDVTVKMTAMIQSFQGQKKIARNDLNNLKTSLRELQQTACESIENVQKRDHQYMDGLRDEGIAVANDPFLPQKTRSDFADLWCLYNDLKQHVEAPVGTFDSYSARCDELSRRAEWILHKK
jgi:S1-C subfamily serine protease